MSNPSPQRSDYEFESGKVGLAYGVAAFAGILLATVAVFQILEGIAALADDKVYVRGLSYTYEFDVTTWGWIHLILGLVGLATGIGIIMDQAWARVLGIFIAVLSALSNFMFLPYYPFWSVSIIALDVFVIWALCTQMASERP